jgi:urea carboxylase-associated protein 2
MSSSTTATTAGAREHARAQEGSHAHAMPTLPAATFPTPPADVPRSDLVWAERVSGGNYTHKLLARGTHLRMTDVDGDACASLLLYNADQPWERLNVADTAKVQWQVYPRAGYCLLSDQGRVLATIVADTSGRSDTIFGTSARLRNEERYGDGAAHGPSPAGRELFVVAAAKHGLGRRDVGPSISFFQGVPIDADGRPQFAGPAPAGSSVTLRIELPVIMLIANTAHPLDPRPSYSCGRLDVLAWRGTPTSPDDPQWTATPEGRRAYTNTLDYLTARGLA